MVNKKQLCYITFGVVIFLYMIYSMYSTKFSCDEWANNFRKDFECNLVLTKYENSAGITILKGYNPANKIKVSSQDGSKWVSMNDKFFKIGDTIFKKRGQYTIFIKHLNGNRDTILFKCNDRIYNDNL